MDAPNVSSIAPPAGIEAGDAVGGDPQLLKAAAALRDNRIPIAETLLRRFVEEHPDDVRATGMLADAVLRLGRGQEGEELLKRCLELAPDLAAARQRYAKLLLQQNRTAEAFAQANLLLKQDPSNPHHHNLMATAHSWVGDYAKAAMEFELAIEHAPDLPGLQVAHANTLRFLGRYDECVASYRKAIERFPRFGESYWSLANLKTFRFAPAEVEAMRTLLADLDLPAEDRIFVQFALGKALEDAGHYSESFERYREGNAACRSRISYNSELTTAFVTRSKSFFTAQFFASHAGSGCDAPDPIFVVGMPRSGSTLIEQILASHSAIEGTMELQGLPSLARRTGGLARSGPAGLPFPESLGVLHANALAALGKEYVERTRIFRGTDRPFFVDKLPDNFTNIGFIQLILPNAKIVDVRRHPLDCCVSCFKQCFLAGKEYTYSLGDLGRYYLDYVELMAHFDDVLPGKVHRVIYEEMVADPETQIRRLLDHLGLPFEPQCLKFHETDRAVRTASSQQVRQPMNRDSIGTWRSFEPWLGPLIKALGPALAAYPAAPEFRRSLNRAVHDTIGSS